MDDLEEQQILERLGHWLREVREEAALVERVQPSPATIPAPEEFGLYQLVEAFTTLRHEVNLQTRSSRGLEDQTKALLPALQQALDALRAIEPQEARAAWNAAKPLALALAELDESLQRGREQTERAVATLQANSESNTLARLDAAYAQQSWLTRLCHGRYFQRLRAELVVQQAPSQRSDLLAALVDGYRLIQKRLAQSLQVAGISRIRTVGQLVDPEQMVVLEVVDSERYPAETVCEEIRSGYLWKGRLLRCAEVRATRPATSTTDG
ncbi:nucleotide exchange factor GrpE [Anatilimnocola sp. NA78]|uniref:nucleotide exchange factor GrpE n=1 Tax=Anatilimnocola sp. NA78 TaxID=3415683 RepID=UPI003CE57D67